MSKTDTTTATLEVFQYGPAWGLTTPSPFCLKLETYLRLAQIPHQIKPGDPRKSPTGKLPTIRHKGQLISDSSVIIEYLKKEFGDPLDQRLTPQEKGRALAYQRLIEEHLYWVTVYARWIEPNNWPVVRDAFFGGLPGPLKLFVPNLVRGQVKKQLHGHGLGRLAPAAIYQRGTQDLQALATALGDQPYFLGTGPTSLDASAYGFLANLLYPPLDSPIKSSLLDQPNLVSYVNRLSTHLFPVNA